MASAQKLLEYKVNSAIGQIGQDELEKLKQHHYLLSYTVSATDGTLKKGQRIMRFEGFDKAGKELYYDYGTGISGTLAKLKRSIGMLDPLKSEKIDLAAAKIAKVAKKGKGGQTLMQLITAKDGPLMPKQRQMGTLDPQAVGSESKPVFDYFSMLKGDTHCSDFVFGYVLPRIAAQNGAASTIVPLNTWDMDAQLVSGHFTKLEIGNCDQARLEQLLVDAPAGTVVTFRSGVKRDNIGADDPSHTIISVGKGRFWHNTDDKEVKVTDFNKKSDSEYFFSHFRVVGHSAMYMPDFSKFPIAYPLDKSTFTPESIGMEKGINPENFALHLSEFYHVSKTYALSEILRQNSISIENFRKTNRALSVSLCVAAEYAGRSVSKPLDMGFGTKTPAEVKIAKKPANGVLQAGVGVAPGFINVKDIASGVMARSRKEDFVQEVGKLRQASVVLGISSENFNALVPILYSESYSSESIVPLRKLTKMGADLISNNLTHSKGEFETSWRNAEALLQKQETRADLMDAMHKLGEMDSKIALALGRWGAMKESERLDVISYMMKNDKLALFMANELYKSNFGVIRDETKTWTDARRYEDLEISSVCAHNRGVGSVNLAIMQQNLLIAAQKNGIDAGNFKIDGSVDKQTVELFREVCRKTGIRKIALDGNVYDAFAIDSRGMAKFFSEYKNISNFFGRAEFEGEAKPCLDYVFLNKNQQHLTAYLQNYFYFIRPEGA